MDEILYQVCRSSVSIMDGWVPLPSTIIAQVLRLPIGKVRYHLRKLKKQGLVINDRYGGIDEDGRVFCINGFTVTEEGKKTEEYKKAFEEEKRAVKECFDIDL